MKQSSGQERERAQKWIFFYPVESPTREYIFQRIQFASKTGEAFEADWTHFLISPKDAHTRGRSFVASARQSNYRQSIGLECHQLHSCLEGERSTFRRLGEKFPLDSRPRVGERCRSAKLEKRLETTEEEGKGTLLRITWSSQSVSFSPLYSCVYRQRLKAK